MKKPIITLVGAGHSHLFVFQRLLIDQDFASLVKVVVFAPSDDQVYSGMIPGWISGHYPLDQCVVSLQYWVEILRSHNVDIVWHKRNIVAIDGADKSLVGEDGEHYKSDIISIDVGSQSRHLNDLPTYVDVVPVKPIAHLCDHISLLSNQSISSTDTLLVVGSGAAAVELITSLKDRFPLCYCALQVKQTLLPSFSIAVRRRATRRLRQLGIAIFDQSHSFDYIRGAGVSFNSREVCQPSPSARIKVFNATGVRSPINIRFTNLETDDHGFLLADEFHRCLGEKQIFAVGDICSRPGSDLQRSGVHAVRVGPILAENLHRLAAEIACFDSPVKHQLDGGKLISSTKLKAFKPRRNNLYLISMGVGWAILSWGKVTLAGPLIWRLKDYIDRRFIKRFMG